MRKRSKIAVAFLLLFVFGTPFVLLAPWRSYSTWEHCGAIQMVGNTDELWCFVEIDRMVRRPHMLAEPPTIALGHSQAVLIVSASGDVRRIDVPIRDGITFHPNIGHIFRLGDDFYLYEGFSMNTHRSVYKWFTDHFVLLPLVESEALLKQYALDGIHPVDDAINRRQLAEGWSKIYKAWLIELEPTFEWNGDTLRLGNTNCDNRVTLSISRVDDPSWRVDLISYDRTERYLSRSGHDALCDRQRQEGHPR